MNAIIRNQKNFFGLNTSCPALYHRRAKTCFGVYTTKKYSSFGVIKNSSLSNNHEIFLHPVLGLSRQQFSCINPKNELFINNGNSNLSSYRNFSVSTKLFDQPSSKVEVTVQTIKTKQKEKEEAMKKDLEAPITAKILDTQKPVVVKKSIKQKIMDELIHYYHGFRLLFIDINICRKLVWRVLKGKKLTRREHRLLVRTTSDLFRLVPFSIFIVVPFMEFLLPFFIKFFPGMLPSTFQTAKEREDRLKQSLQVKLEVAKFLQKTLDEMAVQNKEHKSEEAKDFAEFFKKVKDPYQYVRSEEIIKYSKQFDDEITLDSLSRDQLTAICRILELHTIGTTNLLRFQIRMKLRNLVADDRVIQREGVCSLNLNELQQACRARGMRAYGLTEDKLRTQLEEWIDLSLNEKVPPTLLLLSRALGQVPHDTPTSDMLKATISILPDAVGTQTKAAIGEREGKIDNKTKIEILKEEERKIKEELLEEQEVEKEQQRSETILNIAPTVDTQTKSIPLYESKDDTGISSKDAEVLTEALETLSKDKKKLLVQKEAIKDLKEEIEEYKEDVEELHEITKTSPKEEVKETRAAKILFKKVNNMVTHMDNILSNLEKEEKKLRLHPEESEELHAKKKEQLVHIDELVVAIKKLQKEGDESRLQALEKILSKIDADQDGKIKVDDVLRVIEIIGQENVKLTDKQLEEVVAVLDKEEILEAEEKIEKALAKSIKESKQTASEVLVDPAPVIVDKAKELDDKHILRKEAAKSDNVQKDSNSLSGAEIQAAVEKQQDKILQKQTTDIPSTLPPPLPPTSNQTNPKDKML